MRNKIFIAAALALFCGHLYAAQTKKTAAVSPAQRANAIAFKFYAGEAKKPGNIFFSPYSMASAFAMAYEGAKGGTAREIAAVFSFPKKTKDLRADLAGLKKDVNASLKGAVFTQANSFWAQKDYKFRPDYELTLRSAYDAQAMTADFKNKTEEARKQINAWTEGKTRGRIRGLFPEGSLDSLTRLVLVNAVYFKGQWEHPFAKTMTSEADFTRAGDRKVKVQMMAAPKEQDAEYSEDGDLQALRLAYHGGGLSMLLLLPREGKSLGALERGLNQEKLDAIRKGLYNQKVKVFLPRFSFSSGFRLNAALAGLGMPTAFTDKADFSGMDGKKDLYIQTAFQKAFVEVTEEGTEAAAATGVAMGLKSMMLEYSVFRANRPFLFLIEEANSGLILFMGRVEDPNQK